MLVDEGVFCGYSSINGTDFLLRLLAMKSVRELALRLNGWKSSPGFWSSSAIHGIWNGVLLGYSELST